ncbi:HNH endonuclease [Paracoccus alkanivorans]|uniref:Uncharacterized protein n=1 Tax=Paracoccus alkanivorans TaxID=2116655 RepID=A0A3M0MFU7_9RHOB|nr:HNH endonuclease [Paracoccus alkanivorans]RMC30117.1 hypothetical protein C9E81_22025 [Paracoccus alkanivorans]
MSPRLPPDPAEVSMRSERSAYAEAIPPGDVTAPCRGPVLVCAEYNDRWRTPVTMAPLRITDMNGVVLDGGARTQGLPSFGMQDGQDIEGLRPELGRFNFNDAERGPITAELVPDPSAAAEIAQLEAEIIEALRAFAASMDTALQPWILAWEDSGWWGVAKSLFEGAKKGFTAWWEGEGEFWSAVGDWISSLPEMAGEAWDSLTASARALWENRDRIIQILRDLAEGSIEAFEAGIEALKDALAGIPGLEEIAETLRQLVEQSAEWAGAMIEMVKQTRVLDVLGATMLGVVMTTTPNFWADMIGTAGGYLIPEIVLAIIFAIIAAFTGGTGGAALAARLTAFVTRVTAQLSRAGRAGHVVLRMFATLRSVTDKMIDLVKALKRNVAEKRTGATDAEIPIVRKAENPRTRLPRSNGRWDGEPGNGTWYPDNPDAKKVLGDKGVPFKDGRPDFSQWSKGNVEFEPGVLDGTSADFTKVYEQLKEARGLSSNNAARQLLRDAGLTPHHSSDTVIQLIPSDLHNNIPHVGSASDMRGGV